MQARSLHARRGTLSLLMKVRPILVSCLIVTSEEKAQAEGLPIWAEIKGFATAALDPARMGLGPAYAIPKLLGKVGMEMKDVDILEVNEAFASQYLACEKALDSEEWCRDNLGRPAPGAPPRDKTNVNGGAIDLGHPELLIAQPVFSSEPGEMHTPGVIPANATVWFAS